MKVNLLAYAGGVSFLYLLAGMLPVQAMPTFEETASDTQALNSSQNIVVSSNNIFDETIISINEKIESVPVLNQKQESTDLAVAASTFFSQTVLKNPNSRSDSHLIAAAEIQEQEQEQVTSVSQLSDVKPTDWAFQALQSLVERYGCIAGYPNGTYRGNRAMTRYEFAAGLNACLDRVNELIATATADLVKKEDLVTLQRLREEFSAELVTLRGRVDALEAKTAVLEANQFSTTTKLNGEAIISAIGATGGAPNRNDPNIVLVNRVRLNLNTSFTGKDLLITGLQSYNFLGGVDGRGSVQESLGLASPILSASRFTFTATPHK